MSALIEGKHIIAILGSGAREHALAWKLGTSPYCDTLYLVPGNAGAAAVHALNCVAPDGPGIEGMIATLKRLKVSFVVIGPDDLLLQGYTDHLEKAGFTVFGPSRQASKIEWSKAFAKDILKKAGVPTARSVNWTSGDEARTALPGVALEFNGYPLVLKYDGLALGKGVKIAADEAEALDFIADVFDRKAFTRDGGAASAVLVCEEFVVGHEVSIFALCDGKDAVLLEPACDHKRLFDRNKGPNTGGMGAFSPVPWLPSAVHERFKQDIFDPVLKALRDAKAPFKGLLYAGLMVKGQSFNVLEFNARFGDPETQALMPRLTSDLLPLLWACARGQLARGLDLAPLRWNPDSCVNVVAASAGYPESPRTGVEIQGLMPPHARTPGVQIFCAGVKTTPSGSGFLTAGGRVLGVSALGPSLREARAAAYAGLEQIQFEGEQSRHDIGLVYE